MAPRAYLSLASINFLWTKYHALRDLEKNHFLTYQIAELDQVAVRGHSNLIQQRKQSIEHPAWRAVISNSNNRVRRAFHALGAVPTTL